MDGCSNTRFFVTIVMPLSKAIIAIIALYCAVSQWNQYFTSLIYARDDNLVPLQLALRNILLQNKAATGEAVASNMELRRLGEVMKDAVIIVCTVPVMCFDPFIHKSVSKGALLGAING